MRHILLIPNALSLARLGLAVAFPFTTAARPWVIIAAAATDLLDGVIARRYNATSWAGGLLDAVADKVFTLTVLITLTLDGRIHPALAVLLLTRDVTVALIAAYAAYIRRFDAFRKMPSRNPGRAATAALFALFLLLASTPEPTRWDAPAAIVVAAVVAVAAGDYFLLFRRAYRQLKTESTPDL